ncbi:MAG: DUF1343 domain-containing protein [Muribaculaceae bacterium]|nr:DUF1343 domain-containing protein [Muribaculaceae bacterium]
MRLKKLVVALTMLVAFGSAMLSAQEVVVGAAQVDEYIPLLKGKKIGLFSNHTGMVGDRHTLDVMLENGLDVEVIYSPEHGFRGTADAGESVNSEVDSKTGIRIESLYGSNKKKALSKDSIDKIDIIVTDIQDVGLRFYTYYCTMVDLMNAAAECGKEFMVFDRPNPNGMYVDGPTLDMKLKSGVGKLPIPVVHGLTLGELALMVNGEKWLNNGAVVPLQVVKCKNYTHQTRYVLPVAPSPNLRTMRSIYLYPSICYFEGTSVSLGRGTDAPFEIYGHPDMKGCDFEFTPRSVEGAKNPPLLDKKCYGRDLRNLDDEAIIAKGLTLEYLIDAYRCMNVPVDQFFDNGYKYAGAKVFFEKLIGDESIRGMIEKGMSAEEIKATWADDVEAFKVQRKPYLLYEE